MPYVENGGRLDWALMFQRTGTFPLDRTSMFSSYADILAYAKQDGSDSRQLGGTSYVGQIVVNYGPGIDGSTQEVAAYVITAVGESPSVMKLAETTASGDFAEDISNLQTAVGEIQFDISAIEAQLIPATTSSQGFMSAADKTKLDGIATGAQANVIEGVSVQTTAGGGYQALSVVEKIAQLDLSTYATKADISSVFNYKGTVANEAALPQEDNTNGDVYIAEDTHQEYVWTGSEWEPLGVAVDLSGYSTTEQMNTAISNAVSAAIQALDLAEVNVGAANTISAISQTDGVLSVTTTPIQIAQSQVTDLETALAGKADAADIPETIVETVSSSDFNVSGTDTVLINLKSSDSPIAQQLVKSTNGQTLIFGGSISANGTILTGNTGTVQSITAGAGLTTGGDPITATGTISLEEIGSQTTSNEGNTYIQNITTDNYGRVTDVTSAAVPSYSAAAGGGLSLSGTEFSIAANGVLTSMIADAAVTNEKIASVDVTKLVQTTEDELILDGGAAE